MQLYNETQYKIYCNFCSEIANASILDGFYIHLELEEWIEKEHLSDAALLLIDKRMEKECIEEMKQEERSHLHLMKIQ
jgi:hypothetical protein